MKLEFSKGHLWDNSFPPKEIPVGEWAAHDVVIVPPVSSVHISIAAPEEVMEGDEFHADIVVDEVKKMDTYQFQLSYDPTVAKVLEVSNGKIDSTVVPVDMWQFSPPNTPGRIFVLGNMPGVIGVSGSGYLCRVHFIAKPS